MESESGAENLLVIQSSQWELEVNENKNQLFLTYNGENLVNGNYILLANNSKDKVTINFTNEEVSTSNLKFIEKQNNLQFVKEQNENNYSIKISGTNLTNNPNYYTLTLGLNGVNLLNSRTSQWKFLVNEDGTELTLTYTGSNILLAGYYKLTEKQNNNNVLINLPNTINWVNPETIVSKDEALKTLGPMAIAKSKDKLWDKLSSELGENFDKAKVNFILENTQIGMYLGNNSLFSWLEIEVTLKWQILDNLNKNKTNETTSEYKINFSSSDLKKLFPNGIRTW